MYMVFPSWNHPCLHTYTDTNLESINSFLEQGETIDFRGKLSTCRQDSLGSTLPLQSFFELQTHSRKTPSLNALSKNGSQAARSSKKVIRKQNYPEFISCMFLFFFPYVLASAHDSLHGARLKYAPWLFARNNKALCFLLFSAVLWLVKMTSSL